MRIAVVGASGNLGSALIKRLGTEVDVDVLGISRRRPPAIVTNDWLALDISRDDETPRLAKALRGYDVLVHLAWKLQPPHDEEQLWQTNVHGAVNVLSAAVNAGVRHLVVISSVGAYSAASKDQVVDESWPTQGVLTSTYSRHKAAVERLLDKVERDHPDVMVSRIRPALVFQSGAASEIARLFLGRLVPTRLVGRVPLPALPLPDVMTFQAIHAQDLAEGIWTVISNVAAGPFNLAAKPVLTPDDLASALRARRRVAVPVGVLRAAAAGTFYARLQPTEPGWIDLATKLPIMSTQRAEALGWTPQYTSHQALHELITAMREGTGDSAFPPLLPRRSVWNPLRR
jgi:nucleoside-diphosphate-sugar epimerase